MGTESVKYQTASLVANLAISTNAEPTVIAVAGCDEVEAISSLVLAIADHYAAEGNSVLVIGCGRVSAEAAGPLGASTNVGASALAQGKVSEGNAIIESDADQVSIICFDEESETCDGIVASDAFLCMIEGLSQSYDRVVIAVPFAHRTVDAAVVAHLADVTTVVAVQGETNRRHLKKASESLRDAGANIAGICMVDLEARA